MEPNPNFSPFVASPETHARKLKGVEARRIAAEAKAKLAEVEEKDVTLRQREAKQREKDRETREKECAALENPADQMRAVLFREAISSDKSSDRIKAAGDWLRAMGEIKPVSGDDEALNSIVAAMSQHDKAVESGGSRAKWPEKKPAGVHYNEQVVHSDVQYNEQGENAGEV